MLHSRSSAQRRGRLKAGELIQAVHVSLGARLDDVGGRSTAARRFIADETTGAVVAFCTFGVGGLPDTHLFRVEKGKLRFVHTLTHVPPGRQVGGKGKGAPGGGPNKQK